MKTLSKSVNFHSWIKVIPMVFPMHFTCCSKKAFQGKSTKKAPKKQAFFNKPTKSPIRLNHWLAFFVGKPQKCPSISRKPKRNQKQGFFLPWAATPIQHTCTSDKVGERRESKLLYIYTSHHIYEVIAAYVMDWMKDTVNRSHCQNN